MSRQPKFSDNTSLPSSTLYSEEYDAATPLIASLIWSLTNEPALQVVKQLKTLNNQIRAKNIQHKRRRDEGIIDVEFLSSFGSRMEDASLAYFESEDEEKFLHTQDALREAIIKSNWPADWNVTWDQFLEYHEAFTGEAGCPNKALLPSAPTERSSLPVDLPSLEDSESGDIESSSRIILDGTATDHSQNSDTNNLRSGANENQMLHNDKDNGDSDEVLDYDDEYDNDISNWQVCDALDDTQHEAEKEYGIPFHRGAVLGWRNDEQLGYSILVGYQHKGRKVARVIVPNNLPTYLNDSMDIDMYARAWQAFDENVDYSSILIEGTGLVAWQVEEEHQLDPTAVLHPSRSPQFPETYIWVLWHDGIWTWESRAGLHSIMDHLTGFQVDLLIYRLAIAQDGSYREALTGKRPEYPTVRTELPDARSDSTQTRKSGRVVTFSNDDKGRDIKGLSPIEEAGEEHCSSTVDRNSISKRPRRNGLKEEKLGCRPKREGTRQSWSASSPELPISLNAAHPLSDPEHFRSSRPRNEKTNGESKRGLGQRRPIRSLGRSGSTQSSLAEAWHPEDDISPSTGQSTRRPIRRALF
ncbi:hypothetical protein BDV40DRAFT_303405 [Aspergillus tamarii]|uniref:Uncharacterized protein n=2 Tax=Aspergillus subgen. Circumdati TaxID=2720871 RepID=A0A5N6UKW3_ASPTM|nr:hypothetical protein BDV40DRAFT_303405 [Aspergillus tamarii]KAE8423653.1 hypothetical protein BDV36DRAFT_290324 [Aspergillus pseudocaelatus]